MKDLSVEAVSERVLSLYTTLDYDHRPFLTPGSESHPDYEDHMSEKYRIEYACFRFALAQVLQPDSIIEIGVRGGVSALAFLHARRQARYLGIDNDLDSSVWGINFCANAQKWFEKLGFNARVLKEDSQKLERFSGYPDLVHVDGDHSVQCVTHDTVAAWKGGAAWILFDDAKDTAVVAGIFNGLRELNRGSAEWAYFPMWTGNILLKTDRKGYEK